MRKKGDIRQGVPLKFTKITKKRKKALKYMKSSCILLHAVALIAVKREVVASLMEASFSVERMSCSGISKKIRYTKRKLTASHCTIIKMRKGEERRLQQIP